MIDDKSINGEENVESSSYGGGDISMFQKDKFKELYEEGMKKKLRQQKLCSISIE